MQKAVAKYGLAAHLALLAVAPLFLFPFFGSKTLTGALLWLCAFAVIWLMLSPSLLGGEMLRDARRRLLSRMARDPLFWVFAVVVVIAGIRALNTGIRVSFDYETAEWMILPPVVPFLPGSVEGVGGLPFAGALSASIVVLGCRHALGRSARMMFLLMLSSLSGIASFVALFLLGSGDAVVKIAASAAPERFSSPGLGFALCFLCSAEALFAVMERNWGKSIPSLIVAVAGNAAAAFVFLLPRDAMVFAIAYVALLLFSGLCTWKRLAGGKSVKSVVVVLLSIGIACAAVNAAVTADFLDKKLSFFGLSNNGVEQGSQSKEDSDEEYKDKVRDALSSLASKVWSENLWTGGGIGSFRFQPRFLMTQEELDLLPRQVSAVPNGWWHLLAERGIVGALLVALPFAFLLISYCLGLYRCIRYCCLPDPAAMLAPFAVAAAVFVTFYGISLFRAETFAITGAIMVISAKSFPRGGDNG